MSADEAKVVWPQYDGDGAAPGQAGSDRVKAYGGARSWTYASTRRLWVSSGALTL